MKRYFIFSIALHSLGLPQWLFANDTVEESYSRGTQLIKEKSYSKAIDLMESVYEDKQHDKTYLYNLGIAYYKNADYDNAARLFTTLVNKNLLVARAYLNLGLVETKKNNFGLAQDYFRLAEESDKQGNIAPLARTMLQRIDDEQTSTVFLEECLCFLFIEAGYEDKILAYDANDIASDHSNRFLGTTVFAQTFLLPQIIKSLGFNILFLNSTNFDDSDFNFNYFSSTLDKGFDWRDYQITLGISPTYMSLARKDYQYAIEGSLNIKQLLGYQENITLTLKTSYIEGVDEYSAIDGTQHKARLTYSFPIHASKNKIYYEFETNDRENRNSPNNYYYDYSPNRNKIQFTNTAFFFEKYSLKTQLSFRHSHYSQDNITNGNKKRREDKQYTIALKLNYDFNKNLDLNAKFDHQRNDSSIDSYSINRKKISFGLDYTF